MKTLRVLIACEFSGVVRSAFRALGHDAWSCDLLTAEDTPSPAWLSAHPEYEHPHFQEDALVVARRGLCTIESMGGSVAWNDVERDKWDLIIAHPPCTYLCNSGVRWLAPRGMLDSERHCAMMKGADLFAALYWSDCKHVAIENPVMHKYARDYLQSSYKIPRFTSSFQPWQHGHGEVKRSCLWLRGLPPLMPSEIVDGRKPAVHHASPSPDRWKQRSRTLPGVAKAMAEQWSDYILRR